MSGDEVDAALERLTAAVSMLALRLEVIPPRRLLHVATTANRQDEEPFRLARLESVVYQLGVMDHLGWELDGLVSLHDHKGVLTATWNREYGADGAAMVRIAWRMQGETFTVQHEVREVPFGAVL